MNQASSFSQAYPPRAVCQSCGRADETLRVVSYPVVVSFIFLTQRLTWQGTWCARHRRLRLLWASIITATIGWWGIPFGLIYTPLALWWLGRGGRQPDAPNVEVLKAVAEEKLKAGDTRCAVRCLEEAPQFGGDSESRARLTQLYLTSGESWPDISIVVQVIVMALALIGSALLGTALGLLDFAVTEVLAPSRSDVSFRLDFLAWLWLVLSVLIGGQLLFALIRRALKHARSISQPPAAALAVFAASLMWLGLLTGEALGHYGGVSSAMQIHEGGFDLSATWGSLLTRGGVYMLGQLASLENTVGILWSIILLSAAVYYLAGSWNAATHTTWWLDQVRTLRSQMLPAPPARSLGVWIAIGASLAALAAAVLAFPQHETLDYFAAIDHLNAGVQFIEKDDTEAGIQELETAIRLKPNWPSLRSSLGWGYLNTDALNAATDEFEAALRADPAWAAAHHGLGVIYMMRGNLGRALDELREAVRFDPESATAHQDLGIVLFERGSSEQALRELRTALDMDETLPEAHRYLGIAYLSQGRMDEALKELEAAVTYRPDDGRLQGELAYAYYYSGQIQKARPAFEQALRELPNDGELHAGLAAALLLDNSTREAEEHVRLALARAPDLPMTQFVAGTLAARKGDLDQTVSQMRRTLQLNPDYLEATFVLARTYTSQGKFDRALEQYDLLSKADPTWAVPHIMQALIYYELDQLDEMTAALAEARGLKAEDANAQYLWARYYMSQHDLAKAEEHLQAAIERVPEDNQTLFASLAVLQAVQGRFDEALQTLKKMDAGLPMTYQAQADVYIEQEKLIMAASALYIAIDQEPEDGSLNSGLSFIYLQQHDLTQAVTQAERAIEKWPYYSEGYVNLALALQARGESDRALTVAQRGIELDPKFDVGHYALGLIYKDQGKNAQAVVAFEKFLKYYLDRAYVRDYKRNAEQLLKELK